MAYSKSVLYSILFLLALPAGALWGQAPDTINTLRSPAAAAMPEPTDGSPEAVLGAFRAANNDSLKMAVLEEEQKTSLELERYYQQALRHRRNTFQWQYSSGIIIFWIVIATVVCGLVYSGFQFYYSIQAIKFRERLMLMRESHQQTGAELKDEAATSFEASLSGVKINSSLVGLLILVISIAFFFLYLTHVYPIDEMRVENKFRQQDSLIRVRQ